jgi:hypothetical protein
MPTPSSNPPGLKIRVRKSATVANVMVGTNNNTAQAMHGSGTPTSLQIPAVAGTLYINDSDSTLWVAVGSQWKMLV